MHPESRFLATMMDRAREWTLFYFNALKDQDLHRRFVCEGHELNSAYWQIAHLATTENGMLLAATGGPFTKFSWAKHFNVGGAGLPPDQCPPFSEVWDVFQEVHAKAMAHIPTLTAEDLERPTPAPLPVLGPRLHDTITHAIRHEGTHSGQLAWLCKLYSIRMI
ncbi:MAG: DinB family protein [Bacteroidetes bacterium]|nr:DinB family protein [Bacteroidota bacterium]